MFYTILQKEYATLPPFYSPEMLERIAEALEVDSPQLFSMETYSQDAIRQFRENLKVNLEKAVDDFIDKGLNEVEILKKP